MHQSTTHIPGFLRNSFRDAICYSLMVGMGESYLVAYALAIGLGEMQAGLISVVPIITGAVLQLFSGYGIRLLNSRKKWVTLCASMQGISLILLAQLPRWKLEHTELTTVIFLLATLYWSSALAAGPCWNIWIGKIVPTDCRISFFSSRARVAQIFVLIGLIVSGVVLEFSRELSDSLYYFSFLFSIAGFFRLFSAFFIYVQDEKNGCTDVLRVKPGRIIDRGIELLQQPRILKMVAYLFMLNLAVYISGPYFTPFMLKQLKLNFFEYTTLISASFIARILANDIFVFLARSKGVKALLYVGVIGIAPLPLLWTLSDAFLYLLVLQVASGFAWGSHELGVTLVLFEKHSEKERSAILTMANLFNSTGMFAGGLVGAQILSAGGISFETYHTIFAASTLARLTPIGLLFFIDHVPVTVRSVYMRIISVKVGGGTMTKPMLYAPESEQSSDGSKV